VADHDDFVVNGHEVRQSVPVTWGFQKWMNVGRQTVTLLEIIAYEKLDYITGMRLSSQNI